MAIVDIKGLNQAAVVAALYNYARPQGMGFLQFEPEPMTEGQASEILDKYRESGARRFDYLKGRVMKVDLVAPCDSFESNLYDRDNGHEAAQCVVDDLRKGSL